MEYYNEDSLYKYFTQEIAESSSLEIEAIQKEIDAIKQRELSKIELEVKHQVSLSLGAELKDIQTGFRNEINKLISDSGKRLLERRAAIVNEVFGEVSNRLKEFQHSPEYSTNVERRLRSLDDQLAGKRIAFLVSPNDAAAMKLLQANYPTAAVTQTPSIRYGGFIVLDQTSSLEINETIDASLESMKQWFYTNSRLFVK